MTPDALVALRERWTEELRAEYGDQWVEDHATMLQSQWGYLIEQKFL